MCWVVEWQSLSEHRAANRVGSSHKIVGRHSRFMGATIYGTMICEYRAYLSRPTKGEPYTDHSWDGPFVSPIRVPVNSGQPQLATGSIDPLDHGRTRIRDQTAASIVAARLSAWKNAEQLFRRKEAPELQRNAGLN